MNDFSLVSSFYTLLTTWGVWFWGLALLIIVVLLIGVWTGFRKLRKYGRSAGKPVLIAVIAGLFGATVCAAVLLSLANASMSSLAGFIDYVFAFFLSLLLGLGVFAAVFSITARKPNI